MAFEDMQAEPVSCHPVENERRPEDRHEIYLVIMRKLNEPAYGMPLPQDLVDSSGTPSANSRLNSAAVLRKAWPS